MSRGVTPVVGLLVLLAVTVLLATSLGWAVEPTPVDQLPTAEFTVDVDASADRVELTHRGGDTISAEELSVTVAINGEPLDFQPPVPFFAAPGFIGGPTGPFNTATKGQFRAGVSASFRVASTNHPQLSSGDDVTVTVSTDKTVICRKTVTAA